jgi:hypothetical protein
MWSLKTACAAGVMVGTLTGAQAGTFIPVVPVANSMFTLVYGINNNNIVVGGYYDSQNVEHGFFGTLDGSYTTFDVMSGTYPGTEVRGINENGDIVGDVNLSQNDATQYFPFQRLADGTTKLIKKDGGSIGGLIGEINGKGVFTGEYFGQDGFRGYTGKQFKYKSDVTVDTDFDRVIARGINDKGDVVGYTGLGPTNTGFWIHEGATNVIAYPDPNATSTYLQSINNKGLITGYWTNGGGGSFGFSLDTKKDKYKSIIGPGGGATQVFGVNDSGLAATLVFTGNGPVSYIYCPLAANKCPSGGLPMVTHHAAVAISR